MATQRGVTVTTKHPSNEKFYRGYWIIWNSGGLWEVDKRMFDTLQRAKDFVDEQIRMCYNI